VKHWIRLLVVMAMVPLLYTCGTTWTYNPKWRSQDVRPDFIFGKDAIEVTLRSDPRLNLYEDEPHALRVCVYQLDSPRAYNQLAGQSKGLMTLLSCNLFDGSVISARAVTVHPGKNERVLIDRVDETQYIGIVAGYQKLEEKRISRRIDIPVDTSELVVEQVFYPSKDGTKVPMFVLHHRDLVKDGSHPTVLTGYGGFNMSLTPFFWPTAAAFVQKGGVFAVANLRGGGEYGEAWHEAGMLGNKQNVFDDFAAACEYLAKEGYTSPEHLAVEGGSNGGLLTGALLVQHPELMAAVVCTYPLLDMIRYHDCLMGRYWVAEYGSSEDPEQFEYLLAYSPYHHVTDGAHYPATLFITGDLDTRVDPMHARKMAAMVQAKNASAEPILLRYHTRAGHAAAQPIRDQIDSMVEELGFLAWKLGLELE